jgi:hypothetical protein
VLVQFAATCGEALLSIAEYLVEDVLLVASGGAAAGRGAGKGKKASSSSSPKAAGGNPVVTLEHRVRWAQSAMEVLACLMGMQMLEKKHRTTDYWEQAGGWLTHPAVFVRCSVVWHSLQKVLISFGYCVFTRYTWPQCHAPGAVVCGHTTCRQSACVMCSWQRRKPGKITTCQ